MSSNKKSDLCSDAYELGNLILGMRSAYAKGENVMEYARREAASRHNSSIATLIAYDLQAGSYIAEVRANPESKAHWCKQLASILDAFVDEKSSILEVGCGEATTLAGVVQALSESPKYSLGFDISWSRCVHGMNWLGENKVNASLFVADLFEIPLEDESVDVVYTSHSLEPNGGKEADAIRELMRVARRAVVLIEPIYELGSSEAQKRMQHHGYVRNLKKTAEELEAKISDYRLLDYYVNPLNPSGVVLIEKSQSVYPKSDVIQWRCPLTHSPLTANDEGFYAAKTGVVYPVIAGIPLVRTSHAIIASAFEAIGVKGI